MTRKAQTYLTRIKAAGSIYDLQGIEIAFKQDSTLGWDDIDRLCKAADEKRYTLTNGEDTIRLKNLLFFRVKAEMDAYHDMSHAPESNTAEEIQRQRVRSTKYTSLQGPLRRSFYGVIIKKSLAWA